MGNCDRHLTPVWCGLAQASKVRSCMMMEVSQPDTLSQADTISCCRVPEECPQEVADLIEACMSVDAGKRPSSTDVYEMLLECRE